MLHDRPVLALCTARIQNEEILESVRAFTDEAQRRGYYVLVFNSSLGVIHSKNSEMSCFASFDLIPLDIVDLIAVMHETIGDQAVSNTIAAVAREHRIPLMCYDGQMEGVPSVFSYPYLAFNSLLDHIFSDHGCKRVNLITGIRGDYGSECMVMAYTDALKKHGLPFEEERVAYGDYWDGPAASAAERFLTVDIPEAIICVNDTMALSVCAVLQEHGLNVPDDVIVTGSDGIVAERYFTPRLTTCARDLVRMSAAALDIAELLMDGEDVDKVTEIPPMVQISESCGCRVTEQRDQNGAIRQILRKLAISAIQEDEESGLFGELMGRKQITVIDYLDVISSHIPDDAALCLRDSLSPDMTEESLSHFADASELMSTASCSRNEKRFSIIARSQLIPNLETVLAAGRCVYITTVYLRDEIYGYYAYYGDNISEECFRLPKFIHTAGNIIGSNLQTARLRYMNERLVSARVRDALTGMLNLHGALRAISERMASDRTERLRLVMIVIGLRKLRQINSIFGHTEGDQALLSLSAAIMDCIDNDIVAARVGGDEFLLAFFESDAENDTAEALIDVLKKRLTSYNQVSGKNYSIEIAVGHISAPVGPALSLDGMLNEAIALKDAEKAGEKSGTPDAGAADPAEMDRIISENLIRYFYQPIVSTKTGHIFAYEALMRPQGETVIPPLTLLQYATGKGRLYEIEWLTYYNVLTQLRAQEADFSDKRIFVNSIPGHFMTDADFSKLKEQFGDLLPRLVVEFTEQAETEGEELRQIQTRCAENKMDLAVDDYGTGYSNITNLLRYSPNFVKIDRSLISGIQEDPKKQHFVTNIIEFAHANRFMALAEGVETLEELRAVIRFGADLIQGNYTARPSAVPITEIDDALAALIVKLNAQAAKQFVRKTFMPAGETSLDLVTLDSEKYTEIYIAQPRIELAGNFDVATGIVLKMKDDLNCHIVLRDVHFVSGSKSPLIRLGRNCRVTLEFQGDNRMDDGGILVPESSTLFLTGRGNLSICVDHTKAFAVGNDADFSCGNISVDMAGILQISTNGDQAIGIGAGTGKGQQISICGTRLFLQMSGPEGVGIGTLDGSAEIELAGCSADFDLNIADGVAIGVNSGTPKIRCNTVDISFSGSGRELTCLGSVSGGGDITLTESAVRTKLSGQRIICAGSGDAAPRISMRSCKADIRLEGTKAVDLGSCEQDAELALVDTDLNIYLRSATAIHLGAGQDACIRTGGSETLDINR